MNKHQDHDDRAHDPRPPPPSHQVAVARELELGKRLFGAG